MGGENTRKLLLELQEENAQLRGTAVELQSSLRQCESDKLQLQTSYEEALQALADSEAKKETVDKELRLAHEQISSMWKELESLRKKLDGPSANSPVSPEHSLVNPESLELQCTLCNERIKPPSPNRSPPSPHKPPSPDRSPPRPRRGSWLFGRRQQRVQDLEAHSKSCSSHSASTSPKVGRKVAPSSNGTNHTPRKVGSSPPGSVGEYLMVNVTRTPPGTTELAPFKIVTKTNMAQFSQSPVEVHRSQGDFQWLYDALQEACPERIVPPLKPPISLDATMSEFQRFLSRIAAHKTLRKHHLFVVFVSGTAEEVRSLKAKHRPRSHDDHIQYKPAVGRDTNTGPLVATKEYLTTLEQNILGLANHLEQASRRKNTTERTGHWFRAISESEVSDTYLRTAASDLARMCEVMEGHHADSDETLFIQNLQSIADYVRTAQNLLTRVEEAVDKFLYWDEEVTIIEAVTSSPVTDQAPSLESSEDAVFDDSGVSDVTSSSNNSGPNLPNTTSRDSASSGVASVGGISTSEKWAQASKYCADAKDYLEMMCHDLTSELTQFDLQKEKEFKQVLLDYAAAQLEKHEKFQGKWFAMKFLLDTPILPEKRAIQFSAATANAEVQPQIVADQ